MYKLTLSGTQVIRVSDNAHIPFAEGNSDYAEYLKWLSEGGVPLSADPPAPIIYTVSPRQLRQALTIVGLRAQVENIVAAGTQDLKDWWQFSTQFEQNHPMVLAMAAQLNQTPAQVAAVFATASTL